MEVDNTFRMCIYMQVCRICTRYSCSWDTYIYELISITVFLYVFARAIHRIQSMSVTELSYNHSLVRSLLTTSAQGGITFIVASLSPPHLHMTLILTSLSTSACFCTRRLRTARLGFGSALGSVLLSVP